MNVPFADRGRERSKSCGSFPPDSSAVLLSTYCPVSALQRSRVFLARHLPNAAFSGVCAHFFALFALFMLIVGLLQFCGCAGRWRSCSPFSTSITTANSTFMSEPLRERAPCGNTSDELRITYIDVAMAEAFGVDDLKRVDYVGARLKSYN
eukprot:2883468-Pleurochrysis_carterae.AAC.3